MGTHALRNSSTLNLEKAALKVKKKNVNLLIIGRSLFGYIKSYTFKKRNVREFIKNNHFNKKKKMMFIMN